MKVRGLRQRQTRGALLERSSWGAADEVIYQAYLGQERSGKNELTFAAADGSSGRRRPKSPFRVPVWHDASKRPPSQSPELRGIPFWGSTCTKPTVSATLKRSPRRERTTGSPFLPALLGSTGERWKCPGRGPGAFSSNAQMSKTHGFRQAAFKPSATMQSGTADCKSMSGDRDLHLPQLSRGHQRAEDSADKDAVRWMSDPLAVKLRKVVSEDFASFNDVEELENLCVDVATVLVNENIGPACSERGKLLGTEVLAALRVRHRHHGGLEIRRDVSSPNSFTDNCDGLLAYLPKYVKRPVFITILQEEAEARRMDLERMRLSAHRLTFRAGREWEDILKTFESGSLVQHDETRGSSSSSRASSPGDSRKSSICEEPSGPAVDEMGGRADTTIKIKRFSKRSSIRNNDVAHDSGPPKMEPSGRPMSPGLSFRGDSPTRVEKKRELIRKRRSVFQQLQDDAQIHHDDLGKALEATGVHQPKQDWVEECFSDITKYTTMSEDQFLTFARHYEERQRAAMYEAFLDADKDRSGTVDAQELEGILNKFGIEPMDHILVEVTNEVDENGDGVLDFEEFEEVFSRLIMREGFTRSEYETFKAFFNRMDSDESGHMVKSELSKALDWFNFIVSHEDIDQLATQCSLRGKNINKLNFPEFMILMRKVRERELAQLRLEIERNDTDRNGVIDRGEVVNMLRSLGYLVEPSILPEIFAEIGLGDKKHLSFGSLWQCLQVFRSREGFDQKGLDEIDAAFNFCNRMGGDAIGAEDIGRAIRFMGYPLRLDTQQFLTAQVDVDGSGKLDRHELRKMVRMIRYKDFELMRQSFEEDIPAEADLEESPADCAECGNRLLPDANFCRKCGAPRPTNFGKQAESKDAVISTDAAKNLLQRLCCTEPDGQVAPIPFWAHKASSQGPVVDMYSFCRVAMRCRDKARRAFRENGGFSHEELKELKNSFNVFDTDGSGDISREELMIALSQLLPTYANDKKKRSVLVQLVKEADQNGDGGLDFQDFVRLMRQVRDLEAQQKIASELAAVQETSFTSQEIQGFRELFLIQATKWKLAGCEWLSLEDVKIMMSGICPMGAKNSQDLENIFLHVRERANKASESVAAGIEFPDFLRLMKKVIDTNWAGIRDTFFEPSKRTSENQLEAKHRAKKKEAGGDA